MTTSLNRGALARNGLLSDQACHDAEVVLAQCEAARVETVRVLFADQHGILRGKTLVAAGLRSLFEQGIAVPSTLLLKDTAHRTVFPVWSENPEEVVTPMQGASDVLLVPRPETFRVLPWSPHSAWIFCHVAFHDGATVPFGSAHVLERAVATLAEQGLQTVVGLEVEFQIFERVDPALGHAQQGMPGAPIETRNLIQGYQYLTETRYAEAEGILDALRRHAQALGLPVRTVEIEMGPSQFEFTFDPANPMTQADAMVMFRTMAKEVCAANGLHASFMAKPRQDHAMANGWHIHQSLIDTVSGRNLFMPEVAGELTAEASGWIAGLLAHAEAASILVAPTVNSYKRYLPYQLAPNRVQWGEDNRGAMLRGLMRPGDPSSRVENRAPDSTANPYFALAAQIIAGSEGMMAGRRAPAPTASPYSDDAEKLPRSLGQALQAFSSSELFRSALGEDVVDYLTHLKEVEWARYLDTVSEWEQAEYFNLY
ncbi:glutamine synthetase family protein [Phaeobacter inhibens]|uniref:glutamine synthetase family protein n=1 Tax=Phaeobacter inhibens TaxID=221822 RepID=UPI0021A47521|nr:glutamine synthetase family protein [Phaeobacter inhibens]UWR96696.1 glutamine synthetase family protein [Phaeobacter inhibens]